MSTRPRRALASTAIRERYRAIRAASVALAAPLAPEDCQVQSMPDASPVKWHLAHPSWFFETFVLTPHLAGYRPVDPAYSVLFNSYYIGAGERYPRPERGLITRPSLDEVLDYRQHVDAAMERLLDTPPADLDYLIELGLQHEQQHQELILMDILHAFSRNPLDPAYDPARTIATTPQPIEWIDVPGGLYMIGHDGPGFAFDNEGARHRVWLEPFAIAERLVTAGEYRAFIEDGGYRRADLWLSDGWAAVESQGWSAPIYWRAGDDGWSVFSLAGRHPLDPDMPLTNISYYEADAYARWSGHRLPKEAEWEVAAEQASLRQVADTAWQWTASSYRPYPGFREAEGAVGEYNGKFMINQTILRGGASITPPKHARLTYRNFFPAAARWAFSGIRLVK